VVSIRGARNPLVYANEGFRLALTPNMPHMSMPAIYAALIGFSIFFTWLGLRKFQESRPRLSLLTLSQQLRDRRV
jgi:hypothetical protein